METSWQVPFEQWLVEPPRPSGGLQKELAPEDRAGGEPVYTNVRRKFQKVPYIRQSVGQKTNMKGIHLHLAGSGRWS